MTLNIGWIGCGRHATQMLLPQLVRCDARIAAVCDVNPAAAAEAARMYGVPTVHADARALLAHPGLDAIGMAVGPAQHLEYGLAAMARGLPVFMEKPPGASKAEAQRLADAAETAGKPMIVGFMKRYSTGNRIARNVIDRPEFGPALGFLGSYMTAPTYFEGAPDYTPFFLHHCVHYMDLPAWFMGPIAEMQVRARESAPGRLLLHLGLGFESGALGTVVMGTMQTRGAPVERIEIMGDHNRVTVDGVIDVEWTRDPPFKAADPSATLAPEADTLSWRPNFTAAANEDFKGYHALLAEFCAAVRGEPNTAPTIAEAVPAMRWLDRLRAAHAR
jgi:myo-inositol 2-dehydrogenase/D-chiro-inositol 1-dehydrogenase